MRTLLLALLLLVPSVSEAHRPNIKTNLLRLDGSTGQAFIEVRPQLPGRVTLRMDSPPKSGWVRLGYRLHGNSAVQHFQLNALGGQLQQFDLGIPVVSQDKLEVQSLEVLDEDQTTVLAAVGSVIGAVNKPVLTWPLVYVVDSPSNVCFTRGGDTFVFPNGKWTVGFDALRVCGTQNHLNNTGNRAEIEYRINGGAWSVDSLTFDVQSGKSRPNGRPGKYLTFNQLDRLEIKRVDVFDSLGRKFATMGVRMGSQGHYRE